MIPTVGRFGPTPGERGARGAVRCCPLKGGHSTPHPAGSPGAGRLAQRLGPGRTILPAPSRKTEELSLPPGRGARDHDAKRNAAMTTDTVAALALSIDARAKADMEQLKQLSGPFHVVATVSTIPQALADRRWRQPTMEFAAAICAGATGKGPAQACYCCDRSRQVRRRPVAFLLAELWTKAGATGPVSGICCHFFLTPRIGPTHWLGAPARPRCRSEHRADHRQGGSGMSRVRPRVRQTGQHIQPAKLLHFLAVVADSAYGGKLTLAQIHRMQRRMLRAQILRQKAGASSDGA